MPSVPPPAAPEGTQTQHGGQPRTALHDPVQLAAKFRSAGWKKDLEYVLRVYYKYNTASFKEAEWAKLKETFFMHFLSYKEEALGIKERCPMDYMACIEEHFQRATGLCLNGLGDFTAWIKQGVITMDWWLNKATSIGVPTLPRWPQVTPSESCQELQMKADTQTTSSSEPNTRAMAAPVAETPVTETPVTETPARSNTPAPMETGRAGDGQSLAKCIKAGVEEEFQQDRPAKHRWFQSKRHKQCFPSPSKTVRGGSPLLHSSTSMRVSNLLPTTMWQVEGSCISIRMCCWERPCTSEIRSPA